jgi:hypothetical protein
MYTIYSMEVQTSFIPKRSLDTTPVRRADTVSVFTVLSTLLFFLSVILLIGVALWQRTLQAEINDVQKVIDVNEKQFSEDKIKEITNVSNRINAAQTILDNHLYTTNIFKLLEKNTVPTVRFSKFSVDPSQTDKESLKVTLSGQSTNYASIALQSYVFEKLRLEAIMSGYEFSNLTLDQAGNVLFDLTATVDKKVAKKEFPGFSVELANIAPIQSLPVTESLPFTTNSQTQ